MAEEIQIPGFEEAIASERKDRSVALLGLGELIAGIKVAPLTPRRLEWLRAVENPFVVGGKVSPAAILQFLWLIHAGFQPGEDALTNFVQSHGGLDADELREGIDEYLDRAFLDSPRGAPGTPYYAPTVSYYHSLVIAYPGGGWTLERVLDTPLPVIFQLIKADDRYNGRLVYNGRSDKVAGDWLDEQNTPKAIARRKAKQDMILKAFLKTPKEQNQKKGKHGRKE